MAFMRKLAGWQEIESHRDHQSQDGKVSIE